MCVLSMLLNVDNVGAEHMRKVGNSRNWNAQFVEITWCFVFASHLFQYYRKRIIIITVVLYY